MWLAEIWRYPIKSMAGELLPSARLTAHGIDGDRTVQVRKSNGQIITARSHPGLLAHRGSLDASGQPLVDGRSFLSAEVSKDVEAAGGPGAHLVRSDQDDRFDILPLLVTTDGMFKALGFDRRRFRPNLVVGGVEGTAERAWEGRQLRIGGVLIGMDDLRSRCIMTTFDPDTLAQDVNVLKRVQRDFDGVVGLNSYVIIPGEIRAGDPVELVPQS